MNHWVTLLHSFFRGQGITLKKKSGVVAVAPCCPSRHGGNPMPTASAPSGTATPSCKGGQPVSSFRFDVGAQALGDQDAPIGAFWQSVQGCPCQMLCQVQRCFPACQELHHPSEVGRHFVPMSTVQSFTQMFTAEAGWTARAAPTETASRLNHIVNGKNMRLEKCLKPPTSKCRLKLVVSLF